VVPTQSIPENKSKIEDVTVDTTIELLWPPSGLWQTGTITHSWGNGEFAIRFEDDPFDEPLSYRLDSYEWRILSKSVVKKEKVEGAEDVEMKGTAEGGDGAKDDEIECVLDHVGNEDESIGAKFDVFRIKWKGYELSEATWEPRENLEDAQEMMERYEDALKGCNPNSSNIRKVRKSPFDNNLLLDLWAMLHDHGDKADNEYGVVWASEGRAFEVADVGKFVSNFMSRNKHNSIKKDDYNSFSQRMTTLGFEQETESKLYHHPCFQSKSKALIEQIGKFSIPLPDADFQAELFKSRVAKERQQHIHPVIADVVPQPVQRQRAPYGSKKRAREQAMRSKAQYQQRGMSGGRGKEGGLAPELRDYNYGLFVPIEMGLDLNQCHLWTEHEVAEWIRHLPDWGNYYAAKFIENGVDGRMLLEFADLELVMKEADIQPIHKATFIYGVNTLRTVRRRGLEKINNVKQS